MAARIRVLATGFGTLPGSNGHASALTSLVEGLRGEVDLVTLRAPEQSHQGRVAESRLFRVRATGKAYERRAAFARSVRRQLEAEHYDLVHVRGADEGGAILPLKDSLGFRLIYEIATFPEPDEPRDVWDQWRERHEECLLRADLVLTPSAAGADMLGVEGHGGKTAVVSPGVDIGEYDFWPTGKSSVLRLLYLGNLEADRDLETVLAAVRELSEERALRVLLAGDPDDGRRIRMSERIVKLGVADVVTVKAQPPEPQLRKFIAAADIALVPASPTERYEDHADIPEPLLVHLACRRPVIAAGLPAIGEVVRDEQDGLLYLPGDVHSLVEAIRQYADDPKLADDLAYGGYLRARDTFSSAARARRLAEVYEMLVPGSQQFDAWDEAFAADLPSGLADLETQHADELDSPGFSADSFQQQTFASPSAPSGFGEGGFEEADILFSASAPDEPELPPATDAGIYERPREAITAARRGGTREIVAPASSDSLESLDLAPESTGSDSELLALATPVLERDKIAQQENLAESTTDVASVAAVESKRPGPEPLDDLDTDAR